MKEIKTASYIYIWKQTWKINYTYWETVLELTLNESQIPKITGFRYESKISPVFKISKLTSGTLYTIK